MHKSRLLAAPALIVLAYLVLGLTNVATRTPWCDEGWFGNPAYNLAYKGFMGTTVLDPASSTWKSVKLTGIDRHTYWVMPLSLLANAAGFRLFGYSIYSMRLLSLLWGLLALAAFCAILWKLTGRPLLAFGGAGLIAIDYHFLMQASDGRMDAMALALGWSGVAAYLLLRERSFLQAVAVSHAFAAIAFFTHPNAVMPALILAATTLYFDRSKVRLGTVAIAALPYLLVGAGWAIYIAQSPADFVTQFLGNAGGRGPTITTPLAALRLEITHRYMDNFGLAPWSTWSGRLNLIPLVIFFAAVVLCLVVREIRRDPAFRLVLLWTAIVLFFLTELEGLKTHFYLIYLTPLFSILLAAAVAWVWQKRPRWRVAICGVMLLFVGLQALRTVNGAWRNRRQLAYDPAVRFMQEHVDPKAFIMGDAALLYGLGPSWNVLDDVRLGYNSGKRPDIVVINPAWQDSLLMMQTNAPAIHAYASHLLATEYREVYNQGGYRVLVHEKRNS
ncbi:MAG: hypothetical protein ABI759_27835 [Candidatus Solibacter sp.]